jgi:hypothetical protein
MAAIALKEAGKIEQIGGYGYLFELENAVPSAANLPYYLDKLREYVQRRNVLDVATRLKLLAEDCRTDPAGLLADTRDVVERLHRQFDPSVLPEIVPAGDFLAADLPRPPELIAGVLHQGSKLILGGASKSYKTWALTDMAVSVAGGVPWLGFATTPGRVLYVNLEIQAPFFQGRLREVGRARGVELVDSLHVWNLRGWRADYRVLIPQIGSHIQDSGYSLVVIDPTYKLLGQSDENSASDIAALLQSIETLATSTGAAVALAGHFAKGHAAAKETIDRISGSGVFARDPDSLITFTRHEEEGAFAVEFVLRNLAPVDPFVVRWEYPLFRREAGLDPAKLKQVGGRPAKYSPEDLLKVLGDRRLKTGEWSQLANEEFGVPNGSFFALRRELETAQKVQKSVIDGRWEALQNHSKTSHPYKDQ